MLLGTVIRWHREGFKRFWRRRSRPRRVGRPGLDREVVSLIRRMSQANVTWGAPRIRNELATLGIDVAVSTVAKYMLRRRKPPSPTWRAFLDNHLKDLVALDFFVVPTAPFGVLFGLVVLAHHRRRVLHFNDYEAADRSSGVRSPAVIACVSARASPHSTIRALPVGVAATGCADGVPKEGGCAFLTATIGPRPRRGMTRGPREVRALPPDREAELLRELVQLAACERSELLCIRLRAARASALVRKSRDWVCFASPFEVAVPRRRASYAVPSRHIAHKMPTSRRATAITAMRFPRFATSASPHRHNGSSRSFFCRTAHAA